VARYRPYKVRLEFLIVLTAVVMTFGVLNLLRVYRRQQERTDYVRTEQQVLPYAQDAILAEQEKLVQFVRDESGRSARDAAALLMQLRHLIELSAVPAARRTSSRTAAEFERIQQNLRRLRAGQPAIFPRGEPFLRAYYSPADRTLQPYGVLVPQDYHDGDPIPLIVTIEDSEKGLEALGDAPPYGGVISAQTAADRMAGHGGIGVEELTALLRDVTQSYSIDPQRVYLVGKGRGADAALQAAVSYPELFAGLVLFGITDACPFLPDEERSRSGGPAGLPQMLDFVNAALCPAAYLTNLSHTRVILLQSAGDERRALRAARALAQRLEEAGVQAEYLELPLAAQEPFPPWAQQYAVASVLSHPVSTRPTDIVYRTASIRDRHAWWVRLDALGDDPTRFSSVRTSVQGKVAQVTTDNVSALTITAGRLPEGVELVRVDGQQFDAPSRYLRLERGEGFWRLSRSRRPAKREGLSGPFSDVLRDPFLVVYGTSGDDETRKELSRHAAERFVAHWQQRYGLQARIKADAQVTAEDRRRFNLVLVGGPTVNSESAQVADRLPVRLEGQRVLIGDRAYEGQDLGMLVCYPNPASPRRMVAMVGGATAPALYQAVERLSWCETDGYMWFDYAVFDARTAGPASCLVLGIFDSQWQLPSEGAGAEWRAHASARQGLVPQHFPPLASAAQGDGPTVFLSDVRPAAMQTACGGVAFDRTHDGRPIRLGEREFEKGLGVTAPSSVTYALSGRFRTFAADVGITSAPAGAPAVVFEVWADGKQLAATTPMSAGPDGTSAGHMQVDVAGVGSLTLTLHAQQGGPAHEVNCVWADAAVSR